MMNKNYNFKPQLIISNGEEMGDVNNKFMPIEKMNNNIGVDNDPKYLFNFPASNYPSSNNLQQEFMRRIFNNSCENLMNKGNDSVIDFYQQQQQMSMNNLLAPNVDKPEDYTSSNQQTKGNLKSAFFNMSNQSMNAFQNMTNTNTHNNLPLKRVESNQEFFPNQKNIHKASENSNELDDKLQIDFKSKKNRDSAKCSRQRKKIYIDLLEKKVVELKYQIEMAIQYIDTSQQQIQFLMSENPELKSMIFQRLFYFEKLSKFINQLSRDNQIESVENLKMTLDSQRYNLGASGVLRRNAINFMFEQIIKQMLQSTYTYILLGYNSKVTDNNEEINLMTKEFKKYFNPENSKEKQDVSSLPIIKKFINHRKNFKKLYIRMKKIKKNLQLNLVNIDNKYDKMTDQMTSEQIMLLQNACETQKNYKFSLSQIEAKKKESEEVVMSPEKQYYNEQLQNNYIKGMQNNQWVSGSGGLQPLTLMQNQQMQSFQTMQNQQIQSFTPVNQQIQGNIEKN